MHVLTYITPDGKNPLREWLRVLGDPSAKAAIYRRLDRLAAGNFGDHKFCLDGVWELRIDVGPGYRVYYAQARQGDRPSPVRRIEAHAAEGHRTCRRLLERLPSPHTMKHKSAIAYDEAIIDILRDDPQAAAEYLNAVLADGDQQEVMRAFRRIAEAFGGVSELARKAELNATQLYRTLSPQGNPELKSLTAMLNAMGMRLAVAPLKRSPARRRRQTVKTA